jgi:uncharacterized damage-inducible protein DinB
MERCERVEPPVAGTEKEMLSGFLDFLRGTIVCKLEGLSDADLRRPHQPSGLTLLGIVKHLADVERGWFREVFAGEARGGPGDTGDPDRSWHIDPGETTADVLALYASEVAKARDIVRKADMDAIAAAPGPDMVGVQLRWIVTHMIEETGRHCGHADLIRESIDGETGE